MAYYDTTWYTNSVGYTAVTAWAVTTAIAAGALRRQLATPTVGNERVFVCIVAGTTGSTEPTWVLTRGAKTTDGTVTWMECTGIAAVNGDKTNTVNWTAAKAIGTPSLGTIIQRNNGASYQICTTAGTLGAAEPAFSDTVGVTTTETSATTVWTSLGPVGGITKGGAPHSRQANVFTSSWFVAGNTVYIGDNHSELQASGFSNVLANSPNILSKLLCHNHTSNYPPASSDLTTGAVIANSNGGGAYGINVTGWWYIYGVTFRAGSGSTGANTSLTIGANSSWYYFDNCSLQTVATGGGGSIICGVGTSSGSMVILNNTTVRFGFATDYFYPQGAQIIWQNTGPVLAAGSAIPSPFIKVNSSTTETALVLEALDLSQLTGILISPNSLIWISHITVKDCNINSAATIVGGTGTGAAIGPGYNLQLVRCDSGATGYKSARYQYEGTESTETSITRVGGAVDPTGQVQSRKIVTSANAQWLRPFKAEPYAIWNPRTAANVTVTVCGISQSGALPNNDDIWMDVEYLGSSATPLGTIVNTTKANLLAANAAVASDGSTWNNTAFITFDPTTAVSTTLSNGNLTATHSNTAANSGVNSTAFATSGKYYFEITIGANFESGTDLIGAMTPNATFSTMLGSVTNCLVIFMSTGSIFSNGGNTGFNVGTPAVGDVIGFALDLNARLGWVRRNAGNWDGNAAHNPATGAGGVTLYAAVGYAPVVVFNTSTAANGAYTLNAGQSTYANAAPSGFGNWPAGYTPFKLVATLSAPQPGLPGYIHVRPKVAKPSATIYIDPQITLS